MPKVKQLDWSNLKPATPEVKQTHVNVGTKVMDSNKFIRRAKKLRSQKRNKAIDKSISEYHDNALIAKFKQL